MKLKYIYIPSVAAYIIFFAVLHLNIDYDKLLKKQLEYKRSLYAMSQYADDYAGILYADLYVRKDPHNDEGYAYLGTLYSRVKAYRKARAAFKHALALNPQKTQYQDLIKRIDEKKRSKSPVKNEDK